MIWINDSPATSESAGSTAGTAASWQGCASALPTATTAASPAICHAPSAKGISATTPARAKPVQIITFRRSTRSASTPATGANTSRGIAWITKIRPSSAADPVIA